MSIANISVELFTLATPQKKETMFNPFLIETNSGNYLFYYRAPLKKPFVSFDPDGALMYCRCTPGLKAQTDTALPVPRFRGGGSSVSAAVLPDGKCLLVDNSTLVLNWMGEPTLRFIPKHQWVLHLNGAYSIEVDFSGTKPLFGKPRQVTALHYPVLSSADRPAIARDGTIFAALDYDIECFELDTQPWEVILLSASDATSSWSIKSIIYREPDGEGVLRLCRPSIVATATGFACAMTAVSGKGVTAGDIFISRSDDGGATWTSPQFTGITGYGHSITMLPSNRLAMIYTTPVSPYGVALAISPDGGQSWPEECRLMIDSRAIADINCRPRFAQPVSPGVLTITYTLKADDAMPATMHAARITGLLDIG